MKDNEIIKALECCSGDGGKYDCHRCPNFKDYIDCKEDLSACALDLINRQKAKIAVLSVENANLKISIEDLKADNSFLTEAVASADAPSPIVSRLIQENNEKHMNIVNDLKAEIESLKADKIIAERHEKDARELYKDVVIQLKTAKSEAIREIAYELFTKFAGHSDYHGDTILCQIICMADGKTTDVAKPLDTSTIKSEAIKEYVTKYKDYIKNFTGCFNPSIGFTVNLDSVLNAADFVAYEMVGDKDV